MTSAVLVNVLELSGNRLELQMEASQTVGNLRECVSKEWSLDLDSFRLVAGSLCLKDTMELMSLVPSEGSVVDFHLVKFDPLPDLGQFERSSHRGIEIMASDGKCTTLRKTSGSPDSNNVFVRHEIREPCFVEFKVVRTRDEMSFGVTYDVENVEKASGFANLRITSTWLYSKKQSMPIFQFEGKAFQSPVVGASGVEQDDLVAVYADPQEREVKFYRNGRLMTSNLPTAPLPAESERPLRMYVMVDDTGDEIKILRFGPGKPYDDIPQ